MKKKILFLFTLFVALLATVSTTIQPTYAFEGTNAITSVTTTAINDDSSNLMGVDFNSSSLQGKHINVILDLGNSISRDEIRMSLKDNSNIYRIGYSNSIVVSSLPHYNDDNTVEFSFYYDSASTGYELMFYTTVDTVKTTSLPATKTIENIDTWLFFEVVDVTSNPAYPYVNMRTYDYEYLNYEAYSAVDSFLLDKNSYMNYLEEDLDFSDLVIKYESDGFAIDKIEVDDTHTLGLVKVYLGYTEETLTEVEFSFELNEAKMYPTLENVNDVAVLPGSWIDLGSWDVDDTTGKSARDMISDIAVFGHETTGEEISDFSYRSLFGTTLSDDWYTTAGTYQVVISQSGLTDMYQWITEISVTDITPAATTDPIDTNTVDENFPVIEGEDTVEFLTEDFSILMLKSQYNLSDEEDINALLSLDIKEDGTTLPEEDYIDGTYTVVLTCEDSDGNITEKTVTVNLVNEIGEDTIVITATLLTALANNWMSLVAVIVVILGFVLVVTKVKTGKKIKRYKRRK
ncbi:MAG: hypothetical protein JEZ05_00295 [Tenericutes bacterium]|nr:hypothetical protein [Mycoplasmatota bacterium]